MVSWRAAWWLRSCVVQATCQAPHTQESMVEMTARLPSRGFPKHVPTRNQLRPKYSSVFVVVGLTAFQHACIAPRVLLKALHYQMQCLQLFAFRKAVAHRRGIHICTIPKPGHSSRGNKTWLDPLLPSEPHQRLRRGRGRAALPPMSVSWFALALIIARSFPVSNENICLGVQWASKRFGMCNAFPLGLQSKEPNRLHRRVTQCSSRSPKARCWSCWIEVVRASWS